MNVASKGLRWRLALIAGLAVVPAVASILHLQSSDRARVRKDTLDENVRLARLAAGAQASVFDGASQLLLTLAALPQLRGTDVAACRALLSNALRANPDYVNISAANVDGSVFCTGAPVDPRLFGTARGRPWFERAMQRNGTALGEPRISAATGKLAVAVAHQVLDSAGAVVRIVAVTIPLTSLDRIASDVPLPPGATLTLFDREGTILTRAPDPDAWVGKRMPDSSVLHRLVAGASEDLREGTGVDGVKRLYATVPVEATFDAGLYLGLGVDHRAAFAEGDRILREYLQLLSVVLVAAIIAGIIGGRTFVSGPVKALQLAEERMRFVLSASGVGVWEANLKTGISHWSEICEAMHGLAPGTFAGTFGAFFDHIHPGDRVAAQQAVSKAIATRKDVEMEYRTVWPDGTVHRISSSGHFFFDEADQPVRGAGVSIDVTQRRLLEEQLRQSMKMEAVGQLAGGIAHDFNNLLTIITGNTELALGAVPQESEISEDLRHSLAAANRAAQLTKQLLAFSRKQVLRPELVDVNEVVEGLTPLLRRLVGADITVECPVDGGTLTTMADRAQLEEAVLNLAMNARDAMPSGGTLRLATDSVRLDAAYLAGRRIDLEPGPYVMLSVSDTGAGMDAVVLERAFEPFFTTKTVGKGSGLRLPSVYGMVKQFGGHTMIESALGRGTTVTILLPCVDAEGPSTTTSAEPAAIEPVLLSG